MLLTVARVLSALMGVTLGYSVLTGGMSIRVFVVPDLLLSAGLVIAALLPAGAAPRALLAANAFAAGVFTVAVSRYLIEDGRINPPLIAYIATAVLIVVALLLRPGSDRAAP